MVLGYLRGKDLDLCFQRSDCVALHLGCLVSSRSFVVHGSFGLSVGRFQFQNGQGGKNLLDVPFVLLVGADKASIIWMHDEVREQKWIHRLEQQISVHRGPELVVLRCSRLHFRAAVLCLDPRRENVGVDGRSREVS